MTPKKLTPKQLEKELRVLKEDIQMSQTGLENCKSEEDRESYIRLEKGYQKQLDDLIKNNPPKIKKVPIVFTYGIKPSNAKPADIPIIFCSAIPSLKKRSGIFFLNSQRKV